MMRIALLIAAVMAVPCLAGEQAPQIFQTQSIATQQTGAPQVVLEMQTVTRTIPRQVTEQVPLVVTEMVPVEESYTETVMVPKQVAKTRKVMKPRSRTVMRTRSRTVFDRVETKVPVQRVQVTPVAYMPVKETQPVRVRRTLMQGQSLRERLRSRRPFNVSAPVDRPAVAMVPVTHERQVVFGQSLD